MTKALKEGEKKDVLQFMKQESGHCELAQNLMLIKIRSDCKELLKS